MICYRLLFGTGRYSFGRRGVCFSFSFTSVVLRLDWETAHSSGMDRGLVSFIPGPAAGLQVGSYGFS